MYNKSMIVSGVIFLALLGGIFYVGTERSKVETTPIVTPTPEYSVSPEATTTDDTATPVGKPQGKIDVRAVCEGALSYTSFTDGASADAYVEECVDGKHPEVIERFIDGLDLDGAMI